MNTSAQFNLTFFDSNSGTIILVQFCDKYRHKKHTIERNHKDSQFTSKVSVLDTENMIHAVTGQTLASRIGTYLV